MTIGFDTITFIFNISNLLFSIEDKELRAKLMMHTEDRYLVKLMGFIHQDDKQYEEEIEVNTQYHCLRIKNIYVTELETLPQTTRIELTCDVISLRDKMA